MCEKGFVYPKTDFDKNFSDFFVLHKIRKFFSPKKAKNNIIFFKLSLDNLLLIVYNSSINRRCKSTKRRIHRFADHFG